MMTFRNKAIAAVAGLSLAAAGSLATVSPAEAKHEAAWAIGGFVVGALLAQGAQAHGARVYGAPHYAAPAYGRPVYRAPVHYAPQPVCWWKKQRVYDPYYGPTVHKVRVCR